MCGVDPEWDSFAGAKEVPIESEHSRIGIDIKYSRVLIVAGMIFAHTLKKNYLHAGVSF